MIPHDPFNRSRLPHTLSREGRVKLLVDFTADVLAERPPTRESLMYLASAFSGYFASGGALGTLERDFLKLTPAKGSKLTACELVRRGNVRPDEGADPPDQGDFGKPLESE
jgi:hypothetical protein